MIDYKVKIFIKIIFCNFIKGFGNAFSLILPYHIKSPYGMMANALTRDWRKVSNDIYEILNTQKK